MKNFIQPGNTLDLTAPAGGVISGMVYKIGTLVGVAGITAAAGEKFPMDVRGVFDQPAEATTAWSEGDALYWDDVAKVFTKTPTGNTKCGVACLAKLSADAIGRVKFVGQG